MRLWSKNMIAILPRQQLCGQWRELSAIIKDYNRKVNKVKKKSAYACDHPLVKYAFNYDLSHLEYYLILVYDEMLNRRYKANFGLLKELRGMLGGTKIINHDSLFTGHHDDTYDKICYHNLLEKHLCGMISSSEFSPIQDYAKTNGII